MTLRATRAKKNVFEKMCPICLDDKSRATEQREPKKNAFEKSMQKFITLCRYAQNNVNMQKCKKCFGYAIMQKF